MEFSNAGDLNKSPAVTYAKVIPPLSVPLGLSRPQPAQQYLQLPAVPGPPEVQPSWDSSDI